MALKTITIDDFSGGRVNFTDQSIIPNNMCASGSLNVWAPERGLTKTPGYVLQNSFTASGSNSMQMLFLDDAVSTAFQLFYRLNITATGGAANFLYLFGSTTTLTDTLTLLGYTTGTISISGANLISATGSGTTWTTNVTGGDLVEINSLSGGRYSVSSVEDNTHLTLGAAVGAAVATGTAYVISPGIANSEIAYASLNGNLCMCTTGDRMHNYSSTGMVRMSAAPQVAYLSAFKNYLFAARSNTAQSRLYWSTIKDPTSWPVNNFIDVDVQNGKISGLFSLGQELIIFKTRGMYKILGDLFDPANPTYNVLKITTPADFIFNSQYSCAALPGGVKDPWGRTALVFYGNGKIYKYIQGTMFITDISPHIIRDLPTTFGTYTDAHGNLDQRVKGIAFHDYYIVKGPNDPNNLVNEATLCLILDRNGSWWYLSNRNAVSNNGLFGTGSMAIVPSLTSRPRLVSHNVTNARMFTWDFIGPGFGTLYADVDAVGAGTATTRAINGTWVSKEFNIEYGIFKWIIIYLQKQTAGNLTVQWSIDQGANVSYMVDMTVGRGQIIRAVIPVQQKGSTIQLTISNNVASQTFKIYGIKIFYEESHMERLL